MSPWAVNTMRGCKVHNDDIGDIPALTAIPVSERQAKIAKHLTGIVVFDKIAGVSIDKVSKIYYGVEMSEIEKRDKNYRQEMRTYESFMKEYKDPKIAAQQWSKYKQELGIKEKPK